MRASPASFLRTAIAVTASVWALAAAVPCKRIWRAVWRQLELPDRLR